MSEQIWPLGALFMFIWNSKSIMVILTTNLWPWVVNSKNIKPKNQIWRNETIALQYPTSRALQVSRQKYDLFLNAYSVGMVNSPGHSKYSWVRTWPEFSFSRSKNCDVIMSHLVWANEVGHFSNFWWTG